MLMRFVRKVLSFGCGKPVEKFYLIARLLKTFKNCRFRKLQKTFSLIAFKLIFQKYLKYRLKHY